jgi:hypothetical protein
MRPSAAIDQEELTIRRKGHRPRPAYRLRILLKQSLASPKVPQMNTVGVANGKQFPVGGQDRRTTSALVKLGSLSMLSRDRRLFQFRVNTKHGVLFASMGVPKTNPPILTLGHEELPVMSES